MSREINPFGLRMPPELRGALEAAAQKSGRSLNAEVVFRLLESLSNDTIDRLVNVAIEQGRSDATEVLNPELAAIREELAKVRHDYNYLVQNMAKFTEQMGPLLSLVAQLVSSLKPTDGLETLRDKLRESVS